MKIYSYVNLSLELDAFKVHLWFSCSISVRVESGRPVRSVSSGVGVV